MFIAMNVRQVELRRSAMSLAVMAHLVADSCVRSRGRNVVLTTLYAKTFLSETEII
jgi:hypothetical protein